MGDFQNLLPVQAARAAWAVCLSLGIGLADTLLIHALQNGSTGKQQNLVSKVPSGCAGISLFSLQGTYTIEAVQE